MYGLKIYSSYVPKTDPCQDIMLDDNESIEANFENFLTYKNKYHGVLLGDSGFVSLRNITAINN